MSDVRQRRAGRSSRRSSRFVLVLCVLGGLGPSTLGVFLATEFTGDHWPDPAWGGRAGFVLLVVTLLSALPLGLVAWILARKGQPLTGALILLAVPLGAAAEVGLEPKILRSIGELFVPYFLAALLMSAGRSGRSLAVVAAVVVGFGAIWAGILLPGDLEARLRNAARAGDQRRVERLLGWRVDPDSPDERGVTALMLAVEANDEPLVRILLERGADPNLTDRSGRSARMRAIEERRSDLTLLFLGLSGDEVGAAGHEPAAPGPEP